jgi:cell fate regulator YaaT (PSP1 superfamily)
VTRYIVRISVLGVVGRFSSHEPARLSRGARVVCRTVRGLEMGQVLNVDEPSNQVDPDQPRPRCDGELLRKVTVEDDLLLARLERRRGEAYRACANLLQERGLTDVLLDVEHLLDGRTLYFYFLGEVSPACNELTAELAAAYESEVKFSQFADTLEHGCGPGCGTEEAAGQGCGTSGGCSSCAVSAACGVKKH